MRARLKGVYRNRKKTAAGGHKDYWFLRGVGPLKPLEGDEGETFVPGSVAFMRARIIAAAQFGGFSLDDTKAMLGEWGAEARAAILYRLNSQIALAARLADSLPDLPAASMEYDL